MSLKFPRIKRHLGYDEMSNKTSLQPRELRADSRSCWSKHKAAPQRKMSSFERVDMQEEAYCPAGLVAAPHHAGPRTEKPCLYTPIASNIYLPGELVNTQWCSSVVPHRSIKGPDAAATAPPHPRRHRHLSSSKWTTHCEGSGGKAWARVCLSVRVAELAGVVDNARARCRRRRGYDDQWSLSSCTPLACDALISAGLLYPTLPKNCDHSFRSILLHMQWWRAGDAINASFYSFPARLSSAISPPTSYENQARFRKRHFHRQTQVICWIVERWTSLFVSSGDMRQWWYTSRSNGLLWYLPKYIKN